MASALLLRQGGYLLLRQGGHLLLHLPSSTGGGKRRHFDYHPEVDFHAQGSIGLLLGATVLRVQSDLEDLMALED